MQRLLTICLAAASLWFAVPVQAAEQPNPVDEASCIARSLKWEGDRCFTGQKCALINGKQGDEAYKGGVLGCSRILKGTKDVRDAAKADPELMRKICAAAGHRPIFNYCFTDRRCSMANGKLGFEAVKDGVMGCSEFGPPPRNKIKRRTSRDV